MTAGALAINAPALLAEVCRTYHWTLAYVMDMPAVSFFAMLKAARRMHALDMLELCDLYVMPSCTAKYYEELKGRYIAALRDDSRPEANAPEEPQRPVMDPTAETTRAAIFSIFAAKKGIL